MSLIDWARKNTENENKNRATPTKSSPVVPLLTAAQMAAKVDERRFGDQRRDYDSAEQNNAARGADASKNYKSVLDKYNKDPYGRGNIDLRLRPRYKNEDGTISTVASLSFNEDGKEILVPTIAFGKDGKPIKLTEQEAINRYRQTGEYLGVFHTVDEANRYANLLHQDQQAFISNGQELVAGTKMTKEQEERLKLELEEYEKAKARETPVFGNTPDAKTVASMAGYTGEKLLAGAVDGLSDMGSYLLAGAATIGRPFTWGSWNEALKNEAAYYLWLANNGPGDQWNKSIDKRYDKTPQAYKDNVGDTWSSIGSLLPGIAIETATAGTAPTQLDAVAAKGIGTLLKGALKRIKPADVYLFGSAAGSSAGAAYEKTGNLGKSMAYGALNGLGEVFTEKLFGGIGGTKVGDELIDLGKIPGIGRIANTKVGGKVLDVGMEGVEEGLMALADPYFQRLTIDPNAEWRGSDVGESTKQGILLSVLLNAMLYPVNRHTRTRAIKNINSTTDAINAILENDADKFEPLSNNATEEEIKNRQSEIKTFRSAYVEIMNENLDFLRSEEGKSTLEALVAEGKEKGVGTASEQIAKEIEADMRSGRGITREQVQKLIISREVEDIKIEPVAWNSDLESGDPINAVGSEISIPQIRNSVKETGTPILQRVEELSKSGQAISAEEAKAASGYGDYGAKMLADTVNNTEGATFRMVNDAMRNAYLAGLTDVDSKKVSFETDLQIDAFTAGKKDAAMNQLKATEKAQYATVYGKESGLIPNDYSKNVAPQMVKALNIVAKNLGLKVMFTDKITVNKRGDEANAQMGEDGIFLISASSSQPLYELILHEPFHRMRQFATQEYYNAMNFAVQHAEQLGIRLEQDNSSGTAFEALTNLYEGKGLSHSEAQILDEIGARFYQKIVSNDADAIDFINKMNQNEDTRTALQKFMDFVKELLDQLVQLKDRLLKQGDYATARELDLSVKELERARELYAKAYKATAKAVAEQTTKQKSESKQKQKNTDTNGGASYSLKTVNGKSVVWVEESGLTNKQLNNHQAVAEYIARHIGEVYTIIESGQKVYIGEDLPREYTQSRYTSFLRGVNQTASRAKNKAVDGFGELIETATNRRWEKTKHGGNKDAKYGMYRYDNSFAFPVKDNQGNVSKVRAFDVELLIRNASDGNKYLYDIVGIKENTTTEIDLLKREARMPALGQATRDSASNTSILQTTENSQENFAEYSDDAAENNLAKDPAKGYDKSYSLQDDVEVYTDQEYRDFGWARENGILSADQNADYRSKFAMAKSGQMKFPRSKKGEYIIPVSDIYDSDKEGINNVLVFAKGTIDKPVITSIIEIYEFDETSLDRTRRYIYDRERRGFQPQTGELFERYFASDFKVRSQQGIFSQSDGDSSDNGYGGRSGRETSEIERGVGEKDYALKEEWHTDLTKAQVKMVEGWLRRAGSPEATKITDTANWYMGRLNGDDIFVIYSTEDAKGPTILYEVKGKQARVELNELKSIMEDYEYGRNKDTQSETVDTVLGGGWLRQGDDLRYNVSDKERGRGNQNVGVLPGQPQGDTSGAFENVIRNIFGKQKSTTADGGVDADASHSLKDDVEVSPKRTKELLDTIEHLKNEFEVTKFAKADPRKLKAMTRKLLREYSSTLEVDTMTNAMGELYRYMANGEDGHPAAWDETFRRAKEIASKIAESAVMMDNSDWIAYQDLRNYLRTTKIYVNPENFGDASGFHRRNFGRILVTTTDRTAMGVDEVFQELADLYPEFFNEEKAGSYSDKLYVMEDVLDSLKPLEFNPFANDMEVAITSIANDVIQNFFAVPQAKPTFADRAEQRVAKARVESARQIASQREKTKVALEKARESKEKALAREREKQRTRLSKMSEERRARVLRAQITRSVGSLSQKLIKATDKKHIPQELQEAVTALCYNINLESNYTYNPKTGTYQKNDGYSYHVLTSKPDMTISQIGMESPFDAGGKLDRRRVVEKGIENVRQKNNPKNTEENAYIYIPDIDRDVLVGKRSLSHGLSRNAEATARVTLNIGDILENSIKINELNPRENSAGGYVLLGIGVDKNNNYYPVRAVVSNYQVDEIEVLDVLYAVNAKKKNQSSNEAELSADAVPPIKGSSMISIADLLELVKNDFSDVMTDDVLKKLGVTRKKSTLSESLKYTQDLLPTKKTKDFRNLKKVYQSIAENNHYGLVLAPELLGANDYGIGNCFDEVMELSDKRIADMTVEELTKVYDVVRLVEHSVLTAGKMFALQKWETLDEVGKAFQKSTATRRPKHALMESHSLLDIETPLTFFSHFGDAGNEFFRALRHAQDREQVMQNELTEVVNQVVSREFVEKAGKELFEFETMGGEKLVLSKAHIMNIYLLSKREQGLKHLIYDEDKGYFGNGIHQPKVGKIRRSAESVRLNKMDLGRILEVIQKDEEAKKICEGLQKATGLLARWGNEASMRVFGYEKFKDPNYWTIKVASEGVHQTVEKNNEKPRSIKNMGSAKAVENKVSNSLEIDDVFAVFARHSSDMLCYSAWLEIMEDASRLYNYQFLDDAGDNTGKSFQSLLDKYAGEGGSKYFFRLMGDIQNGLSAPADTATEETWKKIYGNAQRAAVGGNLRVIVQQPTSLVRAAAVLDSASILGAIGEGVAVKPTLDGWKKAVKYAPIAARKAVGGYEIGADAKGLSDEFYKPETTKGKAKKALSEAAFWGAGKADELTWGIIWNACEIEVNKNKSLFKGSQEYYNAVANLFTKVIDETQVVDGVLQRSQAMRTSTGLMKQMTAFTGEPTQGFNIVLRAYDTLRYETEPAKRTKAKKMLGRAVYVHVMTSITTALAASLVDAIRDDGEEDYWEKFWKAFSGIQGDEKTWFDYVKNFLLRSNVTDNLNPLSFIPLLKDFMSLAQGYNVGRMDASVIGDLGSATYEFVMTLAGEGKKTIGYAGWNVLLRGAKVFGKSPYNFIRDLEGVIRTAQVETGNLKAWYKTEKMRTKPSTNTDAYIDVLYKAYETDNDAYEYIYNDMIKSGVKASTIQEKMEEHMMSAEGVKKVEDLSKRYMPPAKEKKYDKSLAQISSSRVWKSANAEQKKEAKDGLYNFLTSTSEAMEKTRAEARAMGVDETEYTLWQLAKEMVNEDKESLNASEKAAAIELLDMGDAELAYFYNTETADKAYAGGVSMENFAKFKAAVSDLKGDGKKAKVLAYANQYAGNNKEWLFLMGSEYSSYKKRSDYISYFGK